MNDLPPWEEVLSAACRLQSIIVDAVLVGGTAAALYSDHRMSRDADHVIGDLRERFDEILAQLESVAGWRTARVNRPVLILGSLDGIETGLRQLRRVSPLETIQMQTTHGAITLPTEPEMLRIKAWLILTRNATRDYLDFAALSAHLGDREAVASLARMDELYPQDSGESPSQQLMKQLADPRPYDLHQHDLTEYKALKPEWHQWASVTERCRDIGVALMDSLAA